MIIRRRLIKQRFRLERREPSVLFHRFKYNITPPTPCYRIQSVGETREERLASLEAHHKRVCEYLKGLK